MEIEDILKSFEIFDKKYKRAEKVGTWKATAGWYS